MERPAASAVLEMFHLSDQKTAISGGYQFKYCSTANCVALSMWQEYWRFKRGCKYKRET